MKKFFKVFFKMVFWVIVTIMLVTVGFLFAADMDVNFSEGYEKEEAIAFREEIHEFILYYYNEAKDWCGNAFEDTKQWCTNAAENVKSWCANAATNVKNWFGNVVNDVKSFFANNNKDNEIGVDGAKLTEVSSYELCNYTDFTIPYGWTVGKVSSEDPATQEAIMLSKNTITMVVSLKNVEAPKTREALHWTREAMIFDMKSKYNDYIFESLDIIEDKAAIIGIEMPNAETTLYMAIVAAGERTIVVTCQFERVDFVEGEIYFQVALAEMVKNLK